MYKNLQNNIFSSIYCHCVLGKYKVTQKRGVCFSYHTALPFSRGSNLQFKHCQSYNAVAFLTKSVGLFRGEEELYVFGILLLIRNFINQYILINFFLWHTYFYLKICFYWWFDKLAKESNNHSLPVHVYQTTKRYFWNIWR